MNGDEDTTHPKPSLTRCHYLLHCIRVFDSCIVPAVNFILNQIPNFNHKP